MNSIEMAQWLEDRHISTIDAMSSNRREKRSVPDSEKDAKYWERRQRNNLAAKRSRENKKFVDMSTKKKADMLERENALLRREIEMLKSKFGIPLNCSFLSYEKNEDFQEDSTMDDKKREPTICIVGKSESPNTPDVSDLSVHRIKREEDNFSDSDNPESVRNRFIDNQGTKASSLEMSSCGMHWMSTTDRHSDLKDKQIEHSCDNSTRKLIPAKHLYQYFSNCHDSSYNATPTDLTLKINSKHFSQNTHPYKRSESRTEMETKELKQKVNHLSAQLDEMKAIIIKRE